MSVIEVCVCVEQRRNEREGGNRIFPRKPAVVMEATRSPPTKANRVQSSAVSPDFRKWNSCRTMPLIGGFSRGSPDSPTPSVRRGHVPPENLKN
ncbi:hypothetical protein PR048_025380 [Dryococelus australis]|uniref:Uncharacterized protein n=1 Tax=Dryococelus australis TaxID=614101 RepID=A0ABQ9GR71_9NEOP|nr:hypothetical protein PR048_025380 [Dryococelus australis]